MTKSTDFKFCARYGHKKYSNNLQMTNCALSGRGQGQLANFIISHCLHYLRNGYS